MQIDGEAEQLVVGSSHDAMLVDQRSRRRRLACGFEPYPVAEVMRGFCELGEAARTENDPVLPFGQLDSRDVFGQ